MPNPAISSSSIAGYIEVRRLTNAPANMFAHTEYPGNGAFMIPSGDIIIVNQSGVYMISNPRDLLIDGPPEPIDGVTGVDVHRLIDQIAAISRNAYNDGRTR